MTNGVDRRMEWMQTPRADSSPYRSWLHSEIQQLRPSHHPMLLLGDLRNLPVPSASLLLCPHSGRKCRLAGDSPPWGGAGPS